MSLAQFNLFCGSIRDQMKFGQVPWQMWPAQRKVADDFDTFRKIWTLKARTLGLSEEAGFYAFKVAVSEPNSDIVIVSQKLDDAKYFLGRRIGDKIDYAYNLQMEPGVRFPWPRITTRGEEKIVFANGSKIEALSSESNSARSRTNRLIILDEFAQFTKGDGEEILTAIQGSFEIQPRSQLIVISTAITGSYFNEISKKIFLKGEMKGWKGIFLPVTSDPSRDEAWLEKESEDWPDKKLFYRENPRNIDDCFASREGAVWPGFDSQEHVMPVHLTSAFRFYVIYDHGRIHPAVMMFALYDKHEDHLYIFDEIYCKEMEIPEIAYKIRKRLNWYKKMHGLERPIAIADRQCFAKDGRRTIASTLRNVTGLLFRPSDKRNRDGTTDAVGVMFSNGQITIDPSCEKTIEQIENWVWKPTTGKIEKPVDVDDDYCFAAGTIIETPAGPKPIEKIKNGDLVYSHLGVCRATSDSVKTGVKETLKIAWEKGSFRCTASHKFQSNGKYLKAKELKCLTEIPTPTHTTKDTSILMEVDITKTRLAIGEELTQVASRAAEKCTMMFGNSITANLIAQNLLSTTKTEIKTITRSLISKSCQNKTTIKNISKIKRLFWRKISTNVLLGISQKTEKNGTPKTQKKCGYSTGRKEQALIASTAGNPLTLYPLSQKEAADFSAQGTAAPIIEENLASIMSVLFVRIVGEFLQKTNTHRYVIAQETVPQKIVIEKGAKETVYNFSTEHGTYVLENGIVASNCDCLCYLYAELRGMPKKKKIKENIHFNPRFNKRREEIKRKALLAMVGSGDGGGYSHDELEAWQAL